MGEKEKGRRDKRRRNGKGRRRDLTGRKKGNKRREKRGRRKREGGYVQTRQNDLKGKYRPLYSNISLWFLKVLILVI